MLAHIAVVVLLLAVSYLFARIAFHAGLPTAAATVLVGIAAAGIFPDFTDISLTPATLTIFLPALIFDGAWTIDAAVLRRMGVTIAVLAIPGTLLTAAVIAGGTALAGLPLSAAIAAGAILAATDPVAVLALFRALDVPHDLRTIVEGESIANDGVAAILVTTVVAFAVASKGHAPSIPIEMLLGVYASVAGIALGAIVAFASAWLVRRVHVPALVIATTLAVAYGSYALASTVGASGIFASASAGVVLRAAGFGRDERAKVETAWDGIALAANAVVFLLVGLNLKLERIFNEPGLIIATIAAVVLARAGLAFGLAPLGSQTPIVPGWRRAIGLAGVRGGLSLALAIGLPQAFPNRPQVIDAVFAVVFVTLVVQGWALGPLLRRLNLRAN